MSATKSTMTAASIGFAMLFGGGVYLMMNFGSIAKGLAEDYASRALGVSVTIGAMDVSLQDRYIYVKNIKVDNPSGYKKPHVARIEKISIKAGAMGTELIELQDVDVKNADIYLEVKPDGTNLSDIRNNLNRNAGSEPTQGEKAVKVILDKMVMNGTIHPSVTLLDVAVEPISLPPLTLRNIGGQNGAAPGEVIAQIWVPLSRQVLQAANKQGYLQGVNADALKEVGVGQIQQIKDRVNEEINAIGDGIKGLMGGGE